MSAPKYPSLQRDLAWLMAGFIAISAAAGAITATIVDWIIHRHRPA